LGDNLKTLNALLNERLKRLQL